VKFIVVEYELRGEEDITVRSNNTVLLLNLKKFVNVEFLREKYVIFSMN
jgi:hypothetical protein